MQSSDDGARKEAWEDSDYVAQFARKQADDFFRSERHFLSQVDVEVHSVLDIGCSSGRFLELLRTMEMEVAYTGLDISERAIRSAREIYPDAAFHAGDALTLPLDGPFDLVNATGVFQHEPRFEALLERMLDWSARYVLFDVKFADIDGHLVDIESAYSTIGDKRVPFIVLDPAAFLAGLSSCGGLSAISILGYETPQNAITILPDRVSALVSAGVFLEKGESPARTEVDLPNFLVRET